MIANKDNYCRLDFSKINFAKDTISMTEALKNVTPVNIPSKFEITKAEKDYDDKCVKLEISY